MTTPRLIAVAIALCCLSVVIPLRLSAEGDVTFERDQLVIESSGGNHRFQVELAITRPQHQQGLMFRRSMEADEGMLFDFGVDRPASMWMYNTYIPLDMLFIRRDGQVSHIAKYTVPLSKMTIGSRGPVRGVLELNAGTADALGLAVGDQVVHPVFSGD